MTTDLVASYWTIAGNTLPLSVDTPSPVAIELRAEAAARAGFSGLGLYHADLMHLRREPGFAELRRILEANGIRILELEAMLDWFADGERRARSDAVRELLLRAAGELGAFQIKAVADVVTDWDFEVMIREFAALADQVRGAGSRLSLEIMHGSNIQDLSKALRLLDGAGRPNTGLMLDIWHVVRGAIPYAAIAALPRARILGVELNDGLRRPEGSPIEDTIFRRRFCGEGEFDVGGFLAAVKATGYDGPYGVEVLSDRIRDLPTAEAAALASATTRAALEGRRA